MVLVVYYWTGFGWFIFISSMFWDLRMTVKWTLKWLICHTGDSSWKPEWSGAENHGVHEWAAEDQRHGKVNKWLSCFNKKDRNRDCCVACPVCSQAHGEGRHQGLRGRKPGHHWSWTWGTFVRDRTSSLMTFGPNFTSQCLFLLRVRKQSWSPSSLSWAKSSPSCLSSPALWPSRRGFVFPVWVWLWGSRFIGVTNLHSLIYALVGLWAARGWRHRHSQADCRRGCGLLAVHQLDVSSGCWNDWGDRSVGLWKLLK